MIEKPDMNNCSEKMYEKWFWEEYNAVCKTCLNKCKQSHIITLSCSKFNKDPNK